MHSEVTMRKISRKTKQIGIISLSVAIVSTFFLSVAKADEVDVPYLTNIQNYTNSILSVINQLPTYLEKIPLLATTLMASDNAASDPVNWSSSWSNEQTWLSTLGSDALNSEANQTALQTSLLTSFF